MFELIDRDAAGRICKWTVQKHTVKTPNICIVINPNKMPVSIKDLKKEFKADILITNSYIIKRNENLRKTALEKGLHKMLDWPGPIYTDSGAFQYWSRGITGINPSEIIKFQKDIGSDIITPLDVFTTPTDDFKTAKTKLIETIARVKNARAEVQKYFVGPIQGGRFLPLRKKACQEVAKINPDIFAIGGIVPYMEQYRFSELSEIILACKSTLPPNKPIHAFGAGHPMLFALLVAFGCDIFDSAMYSLAAERGAYLTVRGTYQLEDLDEFPCSCPLCSRAEPTQIKLLDKEHRTAWLAKHNLYVTFQELHTIRTAIRENSLWELVQERSRAHPAILEAFVSSLKKFSNFFLKVDPLSKKSALLYSGPETAIRPEVLRAREWLKRVKAKRTYEKKPFGKVPLALKGVYPFGQSLVPEFKEPKIKPKPMEIATATIDYQFGKGASKPFKNSRVEVSKTTGRIRRLWAKDKLLGTFRASDGFFLPTVLGAEMLKNYIKKTRIKDKEAALFISKGRAVFSKFAVPEKNIIPGEEVAITYKNKIIAVGKALLNSEEMLAMERGVAISVRASQKQRE